MDNFGFLKVAAAVPHVRVADCDYNTERMAAMAEEAARRGVEIVAFPELGVTAYTCGDLLLQQTLLDAADEALERLVRATRKLPLTLIAGAPLRHGSTLYNCAVVFTQGKVLGVVPKTYIPDYGEFYENRWFASGAGISDEHIAVAGQQADFGADLTFEVNGAEFGIEICEDLWTAAPPSSQLALNGAKVIFNLSASPESVGKHAYLRQLVAQQSGRAIAAYVYCSAGFGESTTDLVFAGNAVIAENGCILREAARFSPDEQLVVADVDIERLEFERRRNTSFRANEGATENTVIEMEIPEGLRGVALDRDIDPMPFVPKDEADRSERCEEIFRIQSHGLAQRMVHTRSEKAVVGISGGLDSTLALLVTARTFDFLHLDRAGIIGITMPGFGTTDRTYNNALELMRGLGVTIREIPIRDACLLGALILCQRLGGNLDTWMRIHQRKVLFPYLYERMIGKISRIPYGFLENTEIQDALERVSKDPEEVLNGVLESGFSMVCFLISNGCLVVWLITQAPVWISPVIVVLLVGFGFFAVKGGQKQYEAKKEVTLGKRKAAYAEEILGNRDAANERVLFGFGDWVNGIFLKERQIARLRERKARRWWFIGMNMGGFLAIALSILVIFALIFPVVQGNTSVGVFVSLVTSFMAMAQSLTWQLPGMLKEMEQGRQLLGDMKRILELPEYEEKPDSSAALSFESLEFSHVSFHYPNTEAMVLKDMCFRIEKGHHYAFVGRNGCGKSTIVKLILRLYEPDSGEILLNGEKIETFSREQIWKLFGVLFQDYAKYPVSVADNIAPGADAGQRAKIAKAEETSELDNVLEKLPQGMDTVLGKIAEDGVDVSGGEWQRIAMARLYYQDAELKILDEPTAAIDPVREQQIYQKFLKLYQDTTTIMITHRLGATSLCDWIIAIEDGKAMEQGSHEDLMTKNGIYCEMYETQRRWYL